MSDMVPLGNTMDAPLRLEVPTTLLSPAAALMQANDAQRPLASIVSFPDVDVDAPASVQASVPVDGTASVCEIKPEGVISSIKIAAALEVVPERRRASRFPPVSGAACPRPLQKAVQTKNVRTFMMTTDGELLPKVVPSPGLLQMEKKTIALTRLVSAGFVYLALFLLCPNEGPALAARSGTEQLYSMPESSLQYQCHWNGNSHSQCVFGNCDRHRVSLVGIAVIQVTALPVAGALKLLLPALTVLPLAALPATPTPVTANEREA